jgi:hypothetical protein
MVFHILSFLILAHIWIKDKLRRCIQGGSHRPHCENVVGEEQVIWTLMDEADSRSSNDDIWKIAAGDLSVFYYNATLATWFFGLNLVWFNHTPNGGHRLDIL